MKTTDTKGAYPMRPLEMVEFIESAARNFRESYMNEVNISQVVDQKILDAVVVDFVNYIALSQCIDFALHTKDLQKSSKNQERDWYLDFGLTKQILTSNAEKYKANGICKSVMRNRHMNDISKNFEDKDANTIVDDMVVYIFEQLL